MKTKTFLAAILLCAALFSGCRKDMSGKFIGSYSFKISGDISMLADGDTLKLKLVPEQGQMHIVSDRGEEGRVKVTFDNLLGDAFITGGYVSGHTLTLDPYAEKTVYCQETIIQIPIRVIFSGSGEKYDDMLLMEMEYEGEDIVDSDVRCVAQYND